MIGSISYNEIITLAKGLQSSSANIKNIVSNSNAPELSDINGFCDSIDSYVRFLITYIELYQDSDQALKYMIEKNK